ncbi:MAG: hypothetical protein ACI4KR_11520 [Ruminiclostridium sp.]
MILGLFLDGVGLPIIPYVFMILSAFVQIGGFVFLIYRHKTTKSMDAVNTEQLNQVTHIVGIVFIIYAVLEFIGAAACITANNACRGGYHYPAGTPCIFCDGKGANTHSVASDLLMLGIYFDAFIVNSYVVAAINTVKDFLAAKRINL